MPIVILLQHAMNLAGVGIMAVVAAVAVRVVVVMVVVMVVEHQNTITR